MRSFYLLTLFLLTQLISYSQTSEIHAFDSLFNWTWNNSEAVKGDDDNEYRSYRYLESKRILASKYYYDKKKKHIKSISLFSPSCYPQFIVTFKENGDTFRLISLSEPIVLKGPAMPYIASFEQCKSIADSIIREKFSSTFINNHIRFNTIQSTSYVYRQKTKTGLNFSDSYDYYEELPRTPDEVLLNYDLIFNDTLSFHIFRIGFDSAFRIKLHPILLDTNNVVYDFNISYNEAVKIANSKGFPVNDNQTIDSFDERVRITLEDDADYWWVFPKITVIKKGEANGQYLLINCRTGDITYDQLHLTTEG